MLLPGMNLSNTDNALKINLVYHYIMEKPLIEKEFEKTVKKKFNLYNSLFLNLPYSNIESVGMLIPILYHEARSGLDSGRSPREILDAFFAGRPDMQSDREKIDFMFRVVQYVERQVVLYDSVEDASFNHMKAYGNDVTLNDFFHLSEKKNSQEKLAAKLSDFSARIVFTAHPTQFYPPRVLEIINRLRLLINENDINEIDITLQQLGLTSLLNQEKPTPIEEARNILYFFRSVYYHGLGELYNYIRSHVRGRDFDNPGILKLGFWPGGDRDGNPFVTADTTVAVSNELRMALMGCYFTDVKQLEQKLTFRDVEEELKQLDDLLYAATYDAEKVLQFNEIMKPLNKVRDLLILRYNSLYLEELDRLITRVRIFRTHFAALDIRQDHSVHRQSIEAILKYSGKIHESLDEIGEDDLIAVLVNEDLSIGDDFSADGLVMETIRTVRSLKGIQQRNGEEGCNRYIISNSEDAMSVLYVYALLRWCGKEDPAFDIIPLFESIEGMANSGHIMRKLFDIPEYREHLGRRNDRQTIMLGFSDGTKDGGYLRANWSIYKTKEELTAICEAYGVKAIFFDGRGGPPARGGGKTHRFYAAQGRDIADHEIQLTIQGQTISSRYGTQEHFLHNCEQLLTAGLTNSIITEGNSIPLEARELIERLAQISYESYTGLKEHPKFISYLENRSPLKYYGDTNIGSRPSRRGRQTKLELSDLRAIPYVGSWSQLKQNVPGYFGIGTAIKQLIDEGYLEQLKGLFSLVLYFKALILNSMMSLSKCYFPLTAYMEQDPEYGEFWRMLYDEYLLSKEMVLTISGYSKLMEEEHISRNSIEIREQIVLPLLLIQQYALQKIEEEVPEKHLYEKIVRRSMYGNINASRNSA